MKFIINASKETWIEILRNPSLAFKVISFPLRQHYKHILAKLTKNFVKKTEKVEKNNGISSPVHKTLNLDNALDKKIFLIPLSMLDGFSNDTTNNSLR